MDGAMLQQRSLYPIPEAQEQLGGLSRSKLYQLVKSGRLKLVKIGRRSFVTRDEITQFVASLSRNVSH